MSAPAHRFCPARFCLQLLPQSIGYIGANEEAGGGNRIRQGWRAAGRAESLSRETTLLGPSKTTATTSTEPHTALVQLVP